MPGSLTNRLLSWIDAGLAALGQAFIDGWSRVERSYRRPFSRLALRLKFAFYPLLALGAIAWLGWDWSARAHRSTSAENAIFDTVDAVAADRAGAVRRAWSSSRSTNARSSIPRARRRRLAVEPAAPRGPARRSSIAPASRAVGYDVLFTDPSQDDPGGDRTLEAMAEGGAGRFVFASTRLHPDYDAGSPLRASQAPGAFALDAATRRDDPEGRAAAAVRRGDGAIQRDRQRHAQRRRRAARHAAARNRRRLGRAVAAVAPGHDGRAETAGHVSRRRCAPTGASDTRLPHVSAADLLTAASRSAATRRRRCPTLKDRVALVGYTASGLNDAKPTPVDPVMPGVEVHGRSDRSAGRRQRDPVAAGMAEVRARRRCSSLLTAFAFFRGEPATDIDSVFVATNLVLLSAAFVGLTFFGLFFDIFASVGFVSLVFGLCRMYAAIQRGRAVGNGDFLPEFDPAHAIAGSRSRACASCPTRSSSARPPRGAGANTVAGCGASCTRAAMR